MGEIQENIKQTIDASTQMLDAVLDDADKHAKTFQAFTLILYEDTTSYNFNEVINILVDYCNTNNFKYAYIKHDKDIFTEPTFDDEYNLIGSPGEIKKTHYHFTGICNKQVNRMDITSLFIGKVNDNALYNNLKSLKPNKINGSLIYLVHGAYKDRKKYQYPITDIQTNIFEYISYLYDNRSTNSSLFICLKEYLRKNKRYISFLEIDDLFMENDINQSDINSCYSRIRDMVNEHNRSYSSIEYIKGYQEKEKIALFKKIEKENSTIEKLSNVFDRFTIEGEDSKKEIIVYNKKEKKKKWNSMYAKNKKQKTMLS